MEGSPLALDAGKGINIAWGKWTVAAQKQKSGSLWGMYFGGGFFGPKIFFKKRRAHRVTFFSPGKYTCNTAGNGGCFSEKKDGAQTFFFESKTLLTHHFKAFQTMSEISAFIKAYFDWAAQIEKAGSINQARVNFRMITNNKMPIGPHSYASYVEGTLDYKPSQVKGTLFKAAEFYTAQPVEQYFSDRRYDLPQPPKPPQQFVLPAPTAPFNPSKTDKIKLTISNRALATAKSLAVTIEMVTWGGGLIHFDMEVKNGMLVGSADSNSTCVIAFTGKDVFSPPK